MDPSADEQQKARTALGNTNVQDPNQLGELIGHLFLKKQQKWPNFPGIKRS